LAEVYHLIYEDWPASVERQGRVLDSIIRAATPAAKTVVDVACGIGTQSLGLASRGYSVIGSDISAGAIARAKREAATRGLTIDFHLDDMTRLSTYADRSADALIACDNAIPHLLTEVEILGAFSQFFRVIRPGGICVISVRDYAAVTRESSRVVPYGVRAIPEGKVAVFQVWHWEGDQYDLNMYFVRDAGDRVDTQVFRSRYYAVPIEKLIDLFREAGFIDVRRIDDEYFQPLIVARVG
jgi:ubiquinone/menaquinone biosynthesis C-methylase UbiE